MRFNFQPLGPNKSAGHVAFAYSLSRFALLQQRLVATTFLLAFICFSLRRDFGRLALAPSGLIPAETHANDGGGYGIS
jgi:hypothetical protein